MKKNDTSYILEMEREHTNFREVCMGAIAPKTLYRSDHPLADSTEGNILDRQIKQANILCVLNLNDNEAGLRSEKGASWYHTLIRKDCIIALNMDFNFMSNEFAEKLRKGLQYMLWHSGPYLIHCYAGMDRTGFVCAMLEAVMGATLNDIKRDYTLSYSRGFESAINSGKYSDNSKIIVNQLTAMNNDMPISDENAQQAAEQYLLKKVGVSAEELDQLKKILQGCSNSPSDYDMPAL